MIGIWTGPTTPPGNGRGYHGHHKKKLRTENRRKRRALQQAQTKPTPWMEYTGDAVLPQGADDKSRPTHRNSMCPAGLALHHPALETLLNWAEFGCPTQTSKPWSTSEMEEAIARGPHQLALTPEGLNILQRKSRRKCYQSRRTPSSYGRHEAPLPARKHTTISQHARQQVSIVKTRKQYHHS